jgi:hypothetical protein
MKVDQVQSSGRLYPRAAWEKALAEYQKKIQEGRAFGTTGIRDLGSLKLEDIALTVKDARIDGDDVVMRVHTLPTPQGQALGALIEGQVPLKFAPCATGHVEKDGTVSDLELLSVSLVPVVEDPDLDEEHWLRIDNHLKRCRSCGAVFHRSYTKLCSCQQSPRNLK